MSTFKVVVTVLFLVEIGLVLKDYELDGRNAVKDCSEKKKFPVLMMIR